MLGQMTPTCDITNSEPETVILNFGASSILTASLVLCMMKDFSFQGYGRIKPVQLEAAQKSSFQNTAKILLATKTLKCHLENRIQ